MLLQDSLIRLRNFVFPAASGRVYISGTGRSGTTFLTQLLTELGFNTGFFNASTDGYFETARAGLEKDIFDREGPTIVKSPFLCDHVDDVIASGIEIRHVIVTVRDFASAAASRRNVQEMTTGNADGTPVAGGLWGTEIASDQASVLEHKFAVLMEALVRNDVPLTLISFPRMVGDERYLYGKLMPVFPMPSYKFRGAFNKVARPDMVSHFNK